MIPFLHAGETLEPADFHNRVDQAYKELAGRDEQRGAELFEKLIRDNPQEFVIYDAYAEAFRTRKHPEKASRIYQRALGPVSSKSPELVPNIRSKLKQMEDAIQFQAVMEAASPWNEAKLIGTPHFAIRTNLAGNRYLIFAKKVESIFERGKQILKDLFGISVGEFPYTRMDIVGSLEDYRALVKEKGARADLRMDPMVQGYYSLADDSMVIFFDGHYDWHGLAHEMIHFLLRKFVVQNPSLLLDEGFSEYIALKLEKESARADLDTKLNFLRWKSDQGHYQSLKEIYFVWYTFGARAKPEAAVPFYGCALSFIHALLESKDPAMKKTFLAWVDYEAKRNSNTPDSTRAFFDHQLSKEEYRKVEEGWIRHLLELTYEKI